MSEVPVTSSLLSKTKKDPKPPIGLDVLLGSVIADVIPFDLFHGINVEFGLNPLNILKPIL
jgi:hypothetical protein